MDAESRLRIAPARRDGAAVTWSATLRAPDGRDAPITFTFAWPGDDTPAPAARPFLLAALVPAMRVGVPLRVPLPVDAVTLANLMEWQDAMASWRPQALRPVPIRCDVDGAPAAPARAAAITAFSGGVDSTFTVVRNVTGGDATPGRVGPLSAGLLVHGFEIGLARDVEFAGAWERARACLAAFDLTAHQMRTDVRGLESVFGCDWEKETHGIWLAAALACYEARFARLVIPSTYPYPWLRFPWGSNPVTDPLLASATTPVWHDGSAYSKLGKVRAIASHDVVRHTVRVCWEGGRLDRNCGRCFKCVATQVCFWLAGVDAPPAFDPPCDLDDVARLPLRTPQNRWLVEQCRDEAERQGRHALAGALARALAPAVAAATPGWIARLRGRLPG